MVETPGSSALMAPDALDRLDAVVAALLHAGRERQGERVEEEVLGCEAVALDGDVADVPGGPQLPLGRPGLALLVDAGADDAGPELASEPQERVEPGAGLVALLEVDGVEDRTPADPLQGSPRHGALGGVDHDRHAGLRAEAAGHLGHVGHAVGAGVVDADVDQVRALLHLVAGHGDAGVPVAVEHRLAERLGAVGVGALADDEEGRVLAERNRGVDGGRRGLVHRRPRRGAGLAAALDHGSQVGRGGPTAPTDGGDAELGHEAVQVLRQAVGREVVVHVAVDDRREARIGDAGDGDAAGRREVAQRLAHLDRTGGAVEAGHVDLHGVEHGQGGADLGAGQHAAGQLDRHLRLQGHAAVESDHGPAARR